MTEKKEPQCWIYLTILLFYGTLDIFWFFESHNKRNQHPRSVWARILFRLYLFNSEKGHFLLRCAHVVAVRFHSISRRTLSTFSSYFFKSEMNVWLISEKSFNTKSIDFKGKIVFCSRILAKWCNILMEFWKLRLRKKANWSKIRIGVCKTLSTSLLLFDFE